MPSTRHASFLRRWWPFALSLVMFAGWLIFLQQYFFQMELTERQREALEEEVEAFWSDRLADRAEEAWERLGGPLRREYSKEEWVARESQVAYESAETMAITAERRGRARVTVRYRWRLAPELFEDRPIQETTAYEIWETEGEGWRRVDVAEP